MNQRETIDALKNEIIAWIEFASLNCIYLTSRLVPSCEECHKKDTCKENKRIAELKKEITK